MPRVCSDPTWLQKERNKERRTLAEFGHGLVVASLAKRLNADISDG
jgi:hypothetical protein